MKVGAIRGEGSRFSMYSIEGCARFGGGRGVTGCRQRWDARGVLTVPSEYHTRRALMIFRRRLPQYQFNAAAARNPAQFGEAWWTNREWAKVTFDEWLKMLWREAVDRRRKSVLAPSFVVR